MKVVRWLRPPTQTLIDGGRNCRVMLGVGSRFGCREPRAHAEAFVLALVSGLVRSNCWTVAEHAGHASPDARQRLLAAACWEEDGGWDHRRDYVVQHLSDQPDSAVGPVLVVDETGDVKKGRRTVGVQRQYTGTAGRIENTQVGVYLVDATSRGHTFFDRELQLPKSWTDDPGRCAAAGVPDHVTFAAKPALARVMVTRAGRPGPGPIVRRGYAPLDSATCSPCPASTGLSPAAVPAAPSTSPSALTYAGTAYPPAPPGTAGTTGH